MFPPLPPHAKLVVEGVEVRAKKNQPWLKKVCRNIGHRRRLTRFYFGLTHDFSTCRSSVSPKVVSQVDQKIRTRFFKCQYDPIRTPHEQKNRRNKTKKQQPVDPKQVRQQRSIPKSTFGDKKQQNSSKTHQNPISWTPRSSSSTARVTVVDCVTGARETNGRETRRILRVPQKRHLEACIITSISF